MLRLRRRRRSVLKGAAAGLMGGLAGAWAMNEFQATLKKVKAGCDGTSGQKESENNEDATIKAAAWLLRSAAGITLTTAQKKQAGPIVHYGFGATMGAIYGAALEYRQVGLPGGALLGLALFIGADEIAVPALKLSQSPTEYPLSAHASALAAHMVYGLTTEQTRRQLRRALAMI